MRKVTICVLLLAVVGWVHGGTPWVPEPREQWWIERHHKLLDITHQQGKHIQVVFLGDSITERWATNGKEVWAKHYQPRHAFNYGIGGDRTEHVLWRIQHGEFDNLNPKLIVLMIGTNNIPLKNKPMDIAKGVKTILEQLHQKMPNSKILLLSVFPREGETFDQEVHQINQQLATFANTNVEFLNMTTHYETSLNHLKTDLYVPDHLHLSAKGYEAWYQAMEPSFSRLIANKPWDPVPRDQHWLIKHEKLLNQTHQHAADEQVVFLGDSITEGWAGNGKTVWAKHYHSRHAYNYGIGGDRTEHVLWRIAHGEFDKVNPKLIVLMIGTNNIGHNPDSDIAKGVKVILEQLHYKMPHAKILLLSVFPRGSHNSDVHNINHEISKFEDRKVVFYLDMTSHFETSSTQLKTDLYVPDHVHLTAKGYQVWYEAMETLFAQLIKA